MLAEFELAVSAYKMHGYRSQPPTTPLVNGKHEPWSHLKSDLWDYRYGNTSAPTPTSLPHPTDRAEVGVLGDVARHGLVAGRGRHDQQQGVARLLAHGAVAVDEGHQQGENQQVGRALLDGRGPEQHLQYHGLPGHGHTHLGGSGSGGGGGGGWGGDAIWLTQ